MNAENSTTKSRIRSISLGLVIVILFIQNAYLFWKCSNLEKTIEASNLTIHGRIVVVEKAIASRDIADPLQPVECEYPQGSGQSKELPCWIEAYRLLEAPQQFQGKWIGVRGFYHSGFEDSSLNLVLNKDGAKRYLNRMLWIEPNLDLELKNDTEVSIVGRFKRGPAGHLGRYFGELNDSISR